MEIKRNSFFPNLYRWFYGINKRTELTTDGCEYLLKSLVAGFFIIPCLILVLPIVIWELLDKNWELGDTSVKERFGHMVLLSLAIIFLISVGFVISTIWVDYTPKSGGHSMCVIGWTLIGFLTLITVLIAGDNLIDYIKNETRDAYDENGNKIKYTPKNIILAYYKAKKDKNCPRITWKD